MRKAKEVDGELWIGGVRISPLSVETPSSAEKEVPTLDEPLTVPAEFRLPLDWVVSEFEEYAREEDGEVLSSENALAWLTEHLRRHPDDVYVLIEMLRPQRPPNTWLGKLFGTREVEPTPEWRWRDTESLRVEFPYLAVNGLCEPIGNSQK